MLQLICEGRCNPNLDVVDDMVREFQKSNRSPMILSRLVSLQRRLRHLPHTWRGGVAASCDECGKMRKFG